MAKCKYETSNGRCGMKDCYAYRHKCYTEQFCKCHQPQTNADRIRAMSDEELAYWTCCPYGDLCESDGALDGDCMKCTLRWLKQPAEE